MCVWLYRTCDQVWKFQNSHTSCTCLYIYTYIHIYAYMHWVSFDLTSMVKSMSIIMLHYNDVVMSAMASQSTSLTIVYSSVHSGVDQRKHQSSASLAFVWGIHRWPMNSPHKWPVTRIMFPFDDIIIDGELSIVTPTICPRSITKQQFDARW